MAGLRRFSKPLAVATLALSVAIHAKAARTETRKPNILLIIADDQAWHDSGCYGNEQVQTPNIDRLATQGMRFARSFTATAMCSPTRQQLYTGIFPVRNGAYPNHSRVKPGTRGIVHHLGALGYRCGLSGKWHIGPRESFPFESVKGDRKSLGEFVTRDKKQPFLLVYASHNPHCAWTAGPRDAYDPQTIRVPPYLVDTPETRRALCRYYAEVTALDAEVGRCMKLLEENDLADNTMFVYTSEQGAQFPFHKWTCYDLGLRTALIVRWPGRVAPGSVSNAMVQYVDFVPTCIEAAGGRPVEGLDGRSFLPVLLGRADRHHDAVFGVHTTRGIIAGTPCYPIRSIRTETHKLILNLNHKEAFHNVLIAGDRERYWGSWVEKAKTDEFAAERVNKYQHRPAEELYDVVKDPYEMNNLAGDPRYRPLIDELRKRLDAWMRQQGDRGIETEKKSRKRKP